MFSVLQLKNYLLLLLLLVSTVPVYAQEGLQLEEDYFQSTLSNYQDWLDSTQLSQVLKIETLDVFTDKIELNLIIATRESWLDLRDTYEEDYNRPIGDDLLKKLSFQMELVEDSVSIVINTLTEDYPVIIEALDGQITTLEDEPLISTKGMFKINLADIPQSKKQTTLGDSEDVKNIIKNYLRSHYEQKKVWGKKSRFFVIDNGEELNIEVSNISKEVLDDFLIGYYEFIKIDMEINQKGDVVEIAYELQARYGSGIFVAPRRSGYKDMEPKYSEYVERYRKKFSAMMKEVLSAQKIKG